MAIPIVSQLNDLAVDVSLSGVARGDLLLRGATQWNNLAAGTPGQALIVTDLGDGVLEPRWSSVAIVDHGALTGRAEDDHSQYVHLSPGNSNRNVITAEAEITPLTLKGTPGASNAMLRIANESDVALAYLGGSSYTLYSGGWSWLAGPVGVNTVYGATHGSELRFESDKTRFALGGTQSFGLEIGSPAKGVYVKGSPGQSADLLQFQNSSGSVLARFNKDGFLGIGGSPSAELHVIGNVGLNGSRPVGTDASNKALWLDGGRSFIKGIDNASYFYVVMGSNVNLNAFGIPSRQNWMNDAWYWEMGTYHPTDSYWAVSRDTGSGFQNVFYLDRNGQFGIGGGFAPNSTPAAQFHLKSGSSSRIGMLVEGAAGQVADCFRIQSSGTSALFRISSSGNVGIRTAPSSNNEHIFTVEGAPSSTFNVALFKSQGYPTHVTVHSEYGSVDSEARYVMTTGVGGWTPTSAYISYRYNDRLYLYNDKEALTIERSSGRVGLNKTSSIGAQLHVVPHTPATVIQILQSAANQTANFLEFQNSGGTILSKVGPDGRSYWHAPAAAPTDADIVTGGFSAWIDEANHKIKFRIRYSDGSTYKTGEIALA